MAARIRTIIFRDELAAILEDMIGIDIETDEEIDDLAHMFYHIAPTRQYPEGAIVSNQHERYLIPDFYM